MGAVGHQRREVHVFSDSKMLPLLFSVRIICTICSTMTGAMPSDLVSSTTQGYPSMCATVSICCSPPLMRAARRWGISPGWKTAQTGARVHTGTSVPSG
jgi:hypothetical protein